MRDDFKSRVANELDELQTKLSKLSVFACSEKFASLTDDEQRRLRRQEIAMRDYRDILSERMGADFSLTKLPISKSTHIPTLHLVAPNVIK